MDPYLATFLSYAPWAIIAVVLAFFPLGRKILMLPVLLAFAIVALLAFCEPDLRD